MDAACASSFSAENLAELRNGDCDIVLTGGANLDCSLTSFHLLVRLQPCQKVSYQDLLMRNPMV